MSLTEKPSGDFNILRMVSAISDDVNEQPNSVSASKSAFLYKSVSVISGWILVTRTPYFLASANMLLPKDVSPALVAPYAAPWGLISFAVTLEILIICPLFFLKSLRKIEVKSMGISRLTVTIS